MRLRNWVKKRKHSDHTLVPLLLLQYERKPIIIRQSKMFGQFKIGCWCLCLLCVFNAVALAVEKNETENEKMCGVNHTGVS